jgi:hypothetical protein
VFRERLEHHGVGFVGPDDPAMDGMGDRPLQVRVLILRVQVARRARWNSYNRAENANASTSPRRQRWNSASSRSSACESSLPYAICASLRIRQRCAFVQSGAWTCEHGVALGAGAYQLGPSPQQTIFALNQGLVRSEDQGGRWEPATGRVANGFVYDACVDPTNGACVVAIVDPADETPNRLHVFESLDGGRTFPRVLYDAVPGVDLLGIETPTTEPQTVYVTWTHRSPQTGRRIGITRIAAGSLPTFDHAAELGGDMLGIAAVDPEDARTLYLGVRGAVKDRLIISHDGGANMTMPLEGPRHPGRVPVLAGAGAGGALAPATPEEPALSPL